MSFLNSLANITESASNATAVKNSERRINQMYEFSISDPDMFRVQVDNAYNLLIYYANGFHDDLCIDYFDIPYQEGALAALESFAVKHMGSVSFQVEKSFFKPEVRDNRENYCCFCIVAAFAHLLSSSSRSSRRRELAHLAVNIINSVYPNNPFIRRLKSVDEVSRELLEQIKQADVLVEDINDYDFADEDDGNQPETETSLTASLHESSQEYWYSVNKERYGPMSKQELIRIIRSNELENEALVWSKGMPSWANILDIPELSSLLVSTPPPLSDKKTPPPLQSESPKNPDKITKDIENSEPSYEDIFRT